VTLLFRLSNLFVLPFWGLMILLPSWRWTQRLMRSPWVSAAPALLYVALVVPRAGTIWPAVTKPTLAGIAALLGSPEGATIAWFHFLAFDLFIGRWIYLDSRERQFNALLMAPILFFTLMLGPLGFLTYLVFRTFVSLREAGRVTTQLGVGGERSMKPMSNEAKLGIAEGNSGRIFLQHAWRTNWPLTVLAVAMVLVFLTTIAGILVDHRIITGAPAWLKPAKFAVSVSLYCFTFVWLLGFVKTWPRLARFAANVTVVSFIVEMTVILTQAARGTTSHFNLTTQLNALLWFTMGAFIVVVWTMNLLLAILLIAERISDRPFAWSLRLGLLISLVGMASGFFMVRPTPQQRQSMATGGSPRIVGAHSVGIADGGPGLPFVGWSTVGGVLRVGHFVGIHAMQLLPFFAWWIARRRKAFSYFKEIHRLGFVFIAGSAYLGLVVLLVWEALRGQSVIHPDAQTFSGGIVLAVLTAAAAWAIAVHARRADTKSLACSSAPASGNAPGALSA